MSINRPHQLTILGRWPVPATGEDNHNNRSRDVVTESQRKKCHAIIHGHAVAAAAGNAAPAPGTGFAVDMVAMTTMTMALCTVFGGSISREAAKTLAIATLKNTLLKQPIRTLAKELSKLVPGLGQVVAPGIAVVMFESAGWVLANELESRFAKPRIAGRKPKARKKLASKVRQDA